MMLQQRTVKQSSILDFFRRKNGSLGTTKPLKDLNNGNDATNGSNGKDNNKRPYEVIELDCEGVKEVKFQKTENEIIDVNFISENILDISIETENVDQIMKQKLIKFDDDIALHFKNDFILLKKFRMILASILSEEVHAHLFDENDWEIIENFTSFPGRLLFPIDFFIFKQMLMFSRTNPIFIYQIVYAKTGLDSVVIVQISRNLFKRISQNRIETIIE